MMSWKLLFSFCFASFFAIQVADVHDTARELGKATWSRMATIGAKNLESDSELKAELVRLGTESKVLTPLLLQRIAVVECRADRKLAYEKKSFKGVFQMGADACKEVDVKFEDIDEPGEWKAGAAAGVKYLELTWKRLEDKKIELDAESSETFLLLYLSHQQGYTGAAKLFNRVKSGEAAKTGAGKNMRANIHPKDLEKLDEGDPMTESEFYEYWHGVIKAVEAEI